MDGMVDSFTFYSRHLTCTPCLAQYLQFLIDGHGLIHPHQCCSGPGHNDTAQDTTK